MEYPSEHLLESIEEIAGIKDRLSLDDRSLATSRGLHVQKKALPGGELQYTAGGWLAKKLIFVIGSDNNRNVLKYQPGGWEFKIEETLELCRSLEQASEAMKKWPDEKVRVYQSEEVVDSEMVDRVAEANRQHYDENNKYWRLNGLPRWIEFRDMFLAELKKEWPIEYVEFQTHPRGSDYTMELLKENVAKVYVTGFMYGKGWISPEELTNATLHLGEVIAGRIKRGMKCARSRGIAFADVLAHIASSGTVDSYNTETGEQPVSERPDGSDKEEGIEN
ncbi:MAG: hypothetical protein R6T78_04610 [Dehalococcoidales bacterium]